MSQRGLFSFVKENSPLSIPQEKGFRLAVSISNDLFPSGMEMPARGEAALSAAIRLASAPTIRCCAAVGGSAALRMRHTPCGCRSAHLVEVQTNLLLPTMHTVSIMRTAASEAMPLRQAIPGLIESEVERSYVRVMNRRQSDSEDRSKSNRLDIKQGRHLIRQALQFFELLACNGGVKGQGPLRSLGGPRGIFSHVREYPPFPVQRLRRCFPPPRNARKRYSPFGLSFPPRGARKAPAPLRAQKKSTLTGALFQIAEN